MLPRIANGLFSAERTSILVYGHQLVRVAHPSCVAELLFVPSWLFPSSPFLGHVVQRMALGEVVVHTLTFWELRLCFGVHLPELATICSGEQSSAHGVVGAPLS